tara:strand:+ start:33 stop:476 length:444 start_codon:yes stop_codon:yes gene_type:complete
MFNPHDILGVDEDVDDSELKKRYKFVSKMVHPDKHNNDKSAQALFQMVKNSYESIKKIRSKLYLPKVPEKDTKVQQKSLDIKVESKEEKNTEAAQNITQEDLNTIRILGQQLKDPWFNPNFNLAEFFGDVAIPEKKKTDMRPTSSRT